MRPNGVKYAETLRDELPLVHVEMVHFSCENPSRLPPTAGGSHWLHIAPAGCQRAGRDASGIPAQDATGCREQIERAPRQLRVRRG
jgi:hypothetical protein